MTATRVNEARQQNGNPLTPDMLWAMELLRSLKTGGFYGRVTLSFEQGVVRHAEKQESLKPPR